jgi:hypothetical protein
MFPEFDDDVTTGDDPDNLHLEPPTVNVVVTLPTESYQVVQCLRSALTRKDDVMRVKAVRVVAVSAVPVVTPIDCL